MGTKKKRRDWFFTLQEGGQWLGNLILLYTNTLDKEKKKQRRIQIKRAFMRKAELIPLFIRKQQDRYYTQKEILFYHIYWGICQTLNNTSTYIIPSSKISISKASYSKFVFLWMDYFVLATILTFKNCLLVQSGIFTFFETRIGLH